MRKDYGDDLWRKIGEDAIQMIAHLAQDGMQSMVAQIPLDRKICWRITRVCNLNCQHCLAGHGNRVIGELSSPQRFEALGNVEAVKITQITWTGGEPTLCDDLPALLTGCHKKEIRSVITTHGLGLQDSFLDILNPATDRIRISFDGFEATHNTIRRGPVFSKAIASITRCLRFVPVEANISILRANAEEIPSLLKLLIEYGVSTVVLLSLMMRESAVDNAVLPPTAVQAEQLRQEIAEIAVRFPNVRIRQNTYNDGPDKYVVIESNGDIMLCSDFNGDTHSGSVVGSSGLKNLGRAMGEQTLSHRKVHIVN